MTNAKTVINNLQLMSKALDKVANSPKHYNSSYATYLERMSWEMQKQANDIQEIDEMIGLSFDLGLSNG